MNQADQTQTSAKCSDIIASEKLCWESQTFVVFSFAAALKPEAYMSETVWIEILVARP